MSCLNTPSGRVHHHCIMEELLTFINEVTDNFILKGGTALMLCYNLNRFSEDLDFDGTGSTSIFDLLDTFCKKHGYWCRKAKDTNTTKRVILHYQVEDKEATLKIEVSYRKAYVETTVINGYLTYSIDRIFNLKCNALKGRDRIRDLYDVLYLYSEYKSSLSHESVDDITTALSYKDYDVIADMIETCADPLINKRELENLYLSICSELEIIV